MTAIAPVITIDGPSGAGKGTLCKAMAEALQWHLLDSGAIYRVLALAALHHHVDVTSEDALVPLASHPMCVLSQQTATLKSFLKVRMSAVKSVPVKWRMPPSGRGVSRVREALYCRQRAFRETPCLIADGRDMGTVVFPDALMKIFLTPPRKNVRIDVCYSCRRRALVLTLNAFWPRSKNAIIAIVTVL